MDFSGKLGPIFPGSVQVKETRPRHTKLPQILRDVPGAECIQYIQENDLRFIYLYVYGCEYTVARDILRASKDYGFFLVKVK